VVIVLPLAGTELIFFKVAHMGLYFVFVTKTVLITHWCFSCCWTVLIQCQGSPLLFLTLFYQLIGWGCTRRWEGTQPAQLTSSDKRDIPHHMPSCSAVKAQGRKEEEQTFRVMMFVFPSNHHTCWGPAFLEMSKHLHADGKQSRNWWVVLFFYCLRAQLLL